MPAKFAYLQLRSAPMSGWSATAMAEMGKALSACGSALGIRIWPVRIREKKRSRLARRYRVLLALKDFSRNDELIERVCESVLLVAETLYGPRHELLDSELALPFPWRTSYAESISTRDLIEQADRLRDPAAWPPLDQAVGCHASIPDSVMCEAWALASLVEQHSNLRTACAYIHESQQLFYVQPGQLRESLEDHHKVPMRMAELARWESAFQAAYKAVEAILGDPPKKEDRLRAKLIAAGVDPDEKVGYLQKADLLTVIRAMNRLRDTRIAHGSTPRGVTLGNMIEFQACAKYVVTAALQKVSNGA